MTRRPLGSLFAVTAVLITTACATPVGPAASSVSSQEPAVARGPQRTLILPVTRESTSLVPNLNEAGGTSATMMLFNAGLSLTDPRGALSPMLAELPQLNTDTWRLLPDGKMETIYKLKPGLTWQDGQPLEAQDFAFAKRVYANAGTGAQRTREERLMQSVEAPDPRTVVIRWNGLYAGANSMQNPEFVPLPRHILGEAFATLEQGPTESDTFRNLPYWKAEYVGTGPYRLVEWIPGSQFEAVAFDGFVLGRPKIDRVINRIMSDANIITQILADALDMGELNAEHYDLLARDWVPAGKGSLIVTVGNPQPWLIQQKPEFVGNPALLDLRVRRALAHSLDRQAINDGAFDGKGVMTDHIVAPSAPIFADTERAVTKYPYDPRRSEQLMTEAGLVKGPEGFFTSASGERFLLEFERNTASDRQRLQLIMLDTWQRSGFQINATNIPVGATPEQRSTFKGIQGTGGQTESTFAGGPNVATAANRWTGGNRTGWTSPEYDRAYDAFNTTIEKNERTRLFIEMQRMFTENLPAYLTHFSLNSWAVSARLKGPEAESKGIGGLTTDSLRNWNIHQWEWQ